ncbi:ceramide synthase 6-like [Petromyzon marinus]|uniref:Ceramide synthase 6-like n=1 Tax=Petromyzon marinus TaxID=7757 RepID=A0AAJ7WLF9_PETMA|nr:ceramide synthase 6-like [Petromyzon marinus]XP_032801818.1 ceramide synthase 6-like [Petromyzon marinus]XP_032801819.1 ceramide synthase 6-like [Petromyzon marinus]
MAGRLKAWFWSESFWLPHNVSWEDLRNSEAVTFPQASDLYLAFPLALAIFVVRQLFERFVAKPFAIYLNIQARRFTTAVPHAALENIFKTVTKRPDSARIKGYSKQLDLDVRTIEHWFRQRRNQEKPSLVTKFSESLWRFCFYFGIFCFGLQYLWKTPWLWDTKHCWYNYPYQPLTAGLFWYYIVELAFYWSLMFSQFVDIKRKDFVIMLVHHLATVSLVSFSYVTNMVRVGTLVLCLHDAADFLLETAKMANYAKFQKLCDTMFALFGLVFISTRLVLYPLWILNSTMFESWEIVGPYPSWWVFNPLLLLLQVLHAIWSYLIFCIAFKAFAKGKVSKDERSDVESSSEDEISEQEELCKKAPYNTNTTNGHLKN